MIDSLVPIYILMLLFSVALVFYKFGSNACENNNKIEYRFIPRSHEEMEQNINATDVLNDFV